MNTTQLKRLLIPMIGAVLIAVLGGGQVAIASSSPGALASYDGGTINLADGWSGAAVCAVTSTGNQCFSTQAEFQSWVASANVATEASPLTGGNCSSALELFTGKNYSGTELAIYDQAIWINLSTYDFGDKTNSYKVGACNTAMTSAANGGGAQYPGPTTAGSAATSMVSGWSDRIESVYV